MGDYCYFQDEHQIEKMAQILEAISREIAADLGAKWPEDAKVLCDYLELGEIPQDPQIQALIVGDMFGALVGSQGEAQRFYDIAQTIHHLFPGQARGGEGFGYETLACWKELVEEMHQPRC